ncbi:hypothetical protein KR044_001146, partial [Drosophila immigrans]
ISKLKEEQAGLVAKIDEHLKIVDTKNKALQLCEKNNAIQSELMVAYKQQMATKCTNSMQNIIESASPKKKQETISNTLSCLIKKTGTQEMSIRSVQTFPVVCDSELADSGWTVIQRRKDAGENFNRSWTDYRRGFGQLENNFFIGLEKLYWLTNEQPHELYVYLKNIKNETRFARYSHFRIADESENYKLLSVGKCSGDAGDSLSTHVNMMFSTYDRDNDVSKYNCATEWLSGWWYNSCFHSNLNGLYKDDSINLQNGIKWNSWENANHFTFVQMMIRPIAS